MNVEDMRKLLREQTVELESSIDRKFKGVEERLDKWETTIAAHGKRLTHVEKMCNELRDELKCVRENPSSLVSRASVSIHEARRELKAVEAKHDRLVEEAAQTRHVFIFGRKRSSDQQGEGKPREVDDEMVGSSVPAHPLTPNTLKQFLIEKLSIPENVRIQIRSRSRDGTVLSVSLEGDHSDILAKLFDMRNEVYAKLGAWFNRDNPEELRQARAVATSFATKFVNACPPENRPKFHIRSHVLSIGSVVIGMNVLLPPKELDWDPIFHVIADAMKQAGRKVETSRPLHMRAPDEITSALVEARLGCKIVP